MGIKNTPSVLPLVYRAGTDCSYLWAVTWAAYHCVGVAEREVAPLLRLPLSRPHQKILRSHCHYRQHCRDPRLGLECGVCFGCLPFVSLQQNKQGGTNLIIINVKIRAKESKG